MKAKSEAFMRPGGIEMSAKSNVVVAVGVVIVLVIGFSLGFGYAQGIVYSGKAAENGNLTANTIAYAGQSISVNGQELTFLGAVDGAGNQLNGSFTGTNVTLYIMNFSQVVSNQLYKITSTPEGAASVNMSNLAYMQAVSSGNPFTVSFSNSNLSNSHGAYFFPYTNISKGSTMTISTNWTFSDSSYLVYGTGENRIG